MSALKPDADQIKSFLKELAQKDWIKRTERRWWPYCIFHYTDIRNVVDILKDGYIYSRKHAQYLDKLHISSGSTSVLAGTSEEIKDYVRLYFRPKTPTQYHVEGIRSKNVLAHSKFPDAHCPVPVFFLFDSTAILARQDCRFSDGNLGSPNARIFSTANDLEKLPWTKIYHNGSFDPVERSDIIFRRCAEVIVPEKLGLGTLRYIYCRSSAERETLFYLLPPQLRNYYQSKILSSTRNDPFYRQQTFIETVNLLSDKAIFHFSPDTGSRGPFHLRIEIRTPFTQRTFENPNFCLPNDNLINGSLSSPLDTYTVYLFLDDHLAYANSYTEQTIPF